MSDNQQVVHDRSIGDIIRDTRNLTAEQVQSIVEYQRSNDIRFGEAAVGQPETPSASAAPRVDGSVYLPTSFRSCGA